MPDTMTLRQLAEYLQISIDTIYRMVSQGKIPGVKIGKQWRFSKPAIDRWLAAQSGGVASVLVVGYEPTTSSLILESLHSRGHRTVGVETVEQAALLLKQVSFNVVFIDLEMSGGKCSDVVRSAVECAGKPDVVVIAGDDTHKVADVVEHTPHVTIMKKPIDLDYLTDLVEMLVGRK